MSALAQSGHLFCDAAPLLEDDMIAGRRRGQLGDATPRSGFIARRRADDVVRVDGGQLGLRRIWTISHDRLDHSRDCHRGRCRVASR